MKDYEEIFSGVESTLLKVGSRNLPSDQIRSELEDYKHREGKHFADDEYYDKLVRVVFYSGFRAETVSKRLPVIHAHFPNYKLVAKFGDREVQAILIDEQMIKNRNKVRACVENAKTVERIVGEHGSFQKYIDSFEAAKADGNLMRLKEELQHRFKGLAEITTYHFLTSIGMPVLKPDRVIKRIFTRLGLVGENAGEFAFTQEGRKFATATGHPIRYVDIVFVCYGQMKSPELGLEHGICLEKNPHCSMCGVTRHCDYYARTQGGKGTS
jgi:DNA-3-methyladenine glycosylase I